MEGRGRAGGGGGGGEGKKKRGWGDVGLANARVFYFSSL